MTLKACYNYASVPLARKLGWVDGTPGINAVQGSADSVRQMGDRLGAITGDAGKAMRGLGVSWTGPASASAQQSSAQMVQRAAQTQGLTANGADRVLDYGHSFEWMRKQIVYDDPAKHTWLEQATDRVAGAVAAWTGDGDYQTIAQRNRENDEAANRALGQHEVNTVRADDGFTTAGTDPRPAQPTAAGTAGPAAGGAGHAAGPGTAPLHVAPASVAPGATTAPAGAPPVPPGAGPAAGAGAAGTTPLPTPGLPGSGGGGRTGSGAGGTGPSGASAAPGTGTGSRGIGPVTSAGAGGDPAGTREQLGRQFGQDLGERALGSPSALGGGAPAADWYGAGGATGRGGLPGSPGWGGLDDPLRSDPLGGGAGGRTGAGERLRSGSPPLGEGPATSRTVSVAGRTGNALGSGYAPMMGAGGARQDGTPHRNRYLLPSSAPFDVDVPHTPPVLGPDEDGDG